MLRSDAYNGKRVCFSALVKTVDVAAWAGLWMRVDGEPGPMGSPPSTLAFDNMARRAIHGTTAWAPYVVVLDVAPSASAIALGVLLTEGGTVWLAEPRLEVVGTDVATTAVRPIGVDFTE